MTDESAEVDGSFSGPLAIQPATQMIDTSDQCDIGQTTL